MKLFIEVKDVIIDIEGLRCVKQYSEEGVRPKIYEIRFRWENGMQAVGFGKRTQWEAEWKRIKEILNEING